MNSNRKLSKRKEQLSPVHFLVKHSWPPHSWLSLLPMQRFQASTSVYYWSHKGVIQITGSSRIVFSTTHRGLPCSSFSADRNFTLQRGGVSKKVFNLLYIHTRFHCHIHQNSLCIPFTRGTNLNWYTVQKHDVQIIKIDVWNVQNGVYGGGNIRILYCIVNF